MSVKALEAAFEKSRARASARLVLVALGWYANGEDIAYPSIDSLAQRCGLCRRTVMRCLDTLENLSEIAIAENRGPNGVNQYLLLISTKGVILSPPVTNDTPVISPAKMAHNRVGKTEDRERDNGVADGAVEWPTEEQVQEVARKYPGCPAKGIPPVIPERWAAGHWAFQTMRLQKWSATWPGDMVWRFERHWVDNQHGARGETKTAAKAEGQSVWNLKQKLEQLKTDAARHPANELSSSYFGEPSAEQTAELVKIKTAVLELENRLGGVKA